MTCNCIGGREISFEIKNQKKDFAHAQKIFLDKVVNFKDFSRPNKEINSTFHYSRTFTEFKDFSKTTTKILDLFKIVRTMLISTEFNGLSNAQ